MCMCLGTLEEWTVHETDTWSILYRVPNIAPVTSQILVVRLGQEASLREAKRITISPIVLCSGLLISLLLSWASCCWVKIKFVLLHHLITLFVCLLWRLSWQMHLPSIFSMIADTFSCCCFSYACLASRFETMLIQSTTLSNITIF